MNPTCAHDEGNEEKLPQKAHAHSEMVPLLVIRVEGSGHE
jgi:hypothetical protein